MLFVGCSNTIKDNDECIVMKFMSSNIYQGWVVYTCGPGDDVGDRFVYSKDKYHVGDVLLINVTKKKEK